MKDATRRHLERGDKRRQTKGLFLLGEDPTYHCIDARVTKAIEVMQDSVASQISINVLSRRVNLSSARLRQIFKSEIGMSPARYLCDLRMRHAEHMLGSTFLSVKQIAFRCGARYVSSFVHSFKKRYGMTPTEFRAQEQGISTGPDNKAAR
jgi:transcriptional regulator GlxA family with amidase domain